MVRDGGWSIRMDHLAGTGKQPKSTLNKAMPPMESLATTLEGGTWVTTGQKKTGGYLQKTGVVIWTKEPEGGEIAVDNVSYPTPVGTADLLRTGKLLHTWRNLESKNRRETGSLPPAGNRT